MPEPIISLESIKEQARAVAAKYTDVNAACPHPFDTAAGQAFRDEFLWVRSVIEAKEQESTAAIAKAQTA